MKNNIFCFLLTPVGGPVIEWKKMTSYAYAEQDKVNLTYKTGDGMGINKLHKVRCVNTTTDEIEYLSECKFTNGLATLVEGWVTKKPITNGDWEWEVRLVDGQ